MSTKMNNDQNVPTDDPCYEAIAGQEEIYVEETEEELRALLASADPSPHNPRAEYWREKREQLELGWRTEIE